MPTANKLHPAEQYARDVVKGKIIACKWVRLACQRHIDDRKNGHKRGLRFSEPAAQHAIDFFSFLRHSKGEWAGKRFELSPWQQFIIWCLFGWKVADGTRRFHKAYNQIARKNGKSTLAAGIGLYMLIADQEAGAEIYSAATKKDQAKITHDEATRMVKASPSLRKRIGVYKNNLHIAASSSKFEPLGADADTLDGLNPHGVLIDELHAHKSRELLDVLETALAARRQPLIFIITTAGFDKNSVCYEEFLYSTKVLEGIIQDDSIFAFITCLDETDEWDDPEVWIKSNPNLGVSAKIEYLHKQCKKAQETPGRQNSFRRLNLNEWTEQATRWLDMKAWDESGTEFDPADLEGEACFGGLDLSKTTDITALVWLFPPADPDDIAGQWRVICRFWVPGENIRRRVREDRVPYDVWRDEGYIEATTGNVIDYRYIEAKVLADAMIFNVTELAYDRMFAHQIVNNLLDEGIVMVPFGQGFLSLAPPTRELERLVIGKLLAHNANPVLRWMASNVAVREDPAGNMKPDKAKSTERIDGMVALIMALGRAIVDDDGDGNLDDFLANPLSS